MFRSILLVIVYSCFLLLSEPSAAQAVDTNTASTENNSGQARQYPNNHRSAGVVDGRVSVARLGVPRKARKLYEQAIEAWQKLETAGAQKKVDQALKIDPSFPEALVLNGFMQASHHDWQAAEDNLKAAIRSDPNYCAAHIILAGVYNTQARYDEAQEAAQHAISAGADSWTVQYEIARVFIGKQNYENALAVADVALRSKHGSLLHVAKAHALLGLRRYSEAETELRAYLRYQPTGEGSEDAHHILDQLQSVAVR